MKIPRTIFLYSLAILVAWGFSIPPVAHASAGTLFFSPGSGRFDPGSTFTIGVKTNVAPATSFAGGATVIVQFPKNTLQVTSASTSGSAFGGYTTIDNNAGTVQYTAFLFLPPNGSNLHLFNITFKATGTGNAPLNFGAGSNVHDGPTALQNATYLIAAPTCPAGTIGTPPNCTTPPPPTPTPTPTPTPKPTPTPTPQPSTPAPTPTPPLDQLILPDLSEPAPVVTSTGSLAISNVKSTPAWESGSVTWSTNQPDVTTVVQFGTSKNKLTTTINAQTQEDGTFRVTQNKLTPGTRYYYLINAISTSSGGQATYSGSFTTRGYPTKITVLNGKEVVAGATVKLESNTYTTKRDGSLQALELAAGDYKVTLTDTSGVSKETAFTVKKVEVPTNGKSPAVQSITLDIASPGTSNSFANSILPLIVAVIGGLLFVGLILGFLLWRRKRNEAASGLPVATVDNYAWAPEPSNTIQSVEQQLVPEAEQPYAELGVQDIDAPTPTASQYDSTLGTDTTQYPAEYIPVDASPVPYTENSGQLPVSEPDDILTPVTYSTSPDEEIPALTVYEQSLNTNELENTPLSSPEEQLYAQEQAGQPNSITPNDPLDNEPGGQATHDITIEEVAPDEPSAVYDESTGELSIIHRQGTHIQGGA